MINFNSRAPGTVAGKVNSNGYVHITVRGQGVPAHRVIWLLVNGEIPRVIDHIDGDRGNNALTNLRSVSSQENNRNRKTPNTNTSGVMGVRFDAARDRWTARIERKHLGTFITLFDAACARKSAEIADGYHQNHGRAGK